MFQKFLHFISVLISLAFQKKEKKSKNSQSDSGLCLNQVNILQTSNLNNKKGCETSTNLSFNNMKIPSVCVVSPIKDYCDLNKTLKKQSLHSTSGALSPVPICSINGIKATSSSISTASTSEFVTPYSSSSVFCRKDNTQNQNCQNRTSTKHFTTSLTSSGISVTSRSSSMWSTSTQVKNELIKQIQFKIKI